MIVIKNSKEMKKYYVPNAKAYIFGDDVKFTFHVCVDANVSVCGNLKSIFDIDAKEIIAGNIETLDINADGIYANNISAQDINAPEIRAWDIWARDINAQCIDAFGIRAQDINALTIHANDILAENITAQDISYFAVCGAYNNITCETIKGRRENAKHFCLDGEITIKGKSKYEK